MRILHLISSKGLFGAERVVIELSKGLKKKDCHPVVGVLRNSHNPHTEVIEEARANNVESIIFPCNGKFDMKVVSKIKQYVIKEKIDIVHCHGYKSNIYGLLSSWKRVPIVATNHNWLTSRLRLKIYCYLDSLWIRLFNRIVAVSEQIASDMMKYGVPSRKIEIIDNGIDLERFNVDTSAINVRRELGLDYNHRVIGAIGHLGYEKGYHYLLKAAGAIVHKEEAVKFLIVGDGILRSNLGELVAELGIKDSIIFAGYRNDIPEILSVMDIFVISSIKEGLPMVLLEAMASAKPVIATKVGAIPKVIQHGKTGILVNPRDVSALTREIRLLLNDCQKARELGLNGYNYVKNALSADVMAQKYLSIYTSLVVRH
jgi:glycosyltransferase involved in cell wall biosynthesis